MAAVVRTALVGAAVTVLASGCGGRAPKRAYPETFGHGRDQVWLFRPARQPRAVVVFLHGFGGPDEQVPGPHRAWIDHLTAVGDAVVYPRYETTGNPAPAATIVRAVDRALRRLGSRPPLIVIGYSRGGRLAPDYAARADAAPRAAHPRAVIAVFPGPITGDEQLVNLGTLSRSTRFLILVGQNDRTVGGVGARMLLNRLPLARFPPARIQARVVRSSGTFVANHVAPLGDSAAARRAFWAPADRVIDDAVLSGG